VRGEIRECSVVPGLIMDLAFRRSGLKQPVAQGPYGKLRQ
jgi:hypothetical protein